MSKVKKESDLVDYVVDFLVTQNYNVRLEVPNMGQSADIVALKGRWLTIIEAKIHDWKRGVNQCKAHENVADYICVAISTASISQTLVYHANINGYGIIHCNPKDGECKWFIRPKQNRKVWLPQRRFLLKNMRSMKNGD